jgi:RNA 3'-phosphate cyclase
LIVIDGAQGEGGGQVLRSSLTLSILTGKGLQIERIRARRSKPGLQAQHLQAVEAAAKISQAQVSGAYKGSSGLVFQPGLVRNGRYRFDIGTAGSTSLVLQTIFLPLCFAGGSSTITIRGGTHVPFSPPYHFLEWSWLPVLRQAGIRAELKLEQAGFNPGGGGEIKAIIQPIQELYPIELLERGALKRIQGLSAAANLEADIAKRQKLQALRRLSEIIRDVKIKDIALTTASPGTFLVFQAEFEHSLACLSALGEKGKRAEKVADQAVDAFEAFLEVEAAVEPYLADQLLLPLALARGTSRFRTSQVTGHLLTNAQVIQSFLNVSIDIQGIKGEPGDIIIAPRAGSSEDLKKAF